VEGCLPLVFWRPASRNTCFSPFHIHCCSSPTAYCVLKSHTRSRQVVGAAFIGLSQLQRAQSLVVTMAAVAESLKPVLQPQIHAAPAWIPEALPARLTLHPP
jgi:hypothetical protein